MCGILQIHTRPTKTSSWPKSTWTCGNFDKALEYYQKAQAEAKDPAALDATIQLIKDYQSAEDYVGNGQYTEAIAALKQLQNRVTDPGFRDVQGHRGFAR